MAALDAPLCRKALGLLLVVPVIYGLNVVRVAFIVLAHGQRLFKQKTEHDPVPTDSAQAALDKTEAT